MKNTFMRILSCVLAIVMLMSTCCVLSFADVTDPISETYTAVCGKDLGGDKGTCKNTEWYYHTVAATCEQAGYTFYTCTACGNTRNVPTESAPAKGHSKESTPVVDETHPVVEASCNQAGSKWYHCPDCDKDFEVTAPQLEHNWVAVADDCTKSKCTVCGAEKVKEGSTGHKWKTEYTPAEFKDNGGVAPTTTAQGKMIFECTNEGCKVTKEVIILKDKGEFAFDACAVYGHQFGEKQAAQTLSCTTDGWDAYYKCAWCGQYAAVTTTTVEDEEVEIPDWGEISDTKPNFVLHPGHTKGQHFDAQASTCKTQGNVEYWVCSNVWNEVPCGACLDKDGKVIDNVFLPLDEEHKFLTGGHGDGAEITDAQYTAMIAGLSEDYKNRWTKTEPKCETAGSAYIHCPICTGDTPVVVTVYIKKLGHNYAEAATTTIQPTCTSVGEKRFACLREDCDAYRSESFGVASGHDWKAKNPVDSCLAKYQNGKTYTVEIMCTKCALGDTVTDLGELPSTKFYIGNGEGEDPLANYNVTGKAYYTFTYDAELGHEYVNRAAAHNPATCTTYENYKGVCRLCGGKVNSAENAPFTVGDKLDPLNHKAPEFVETLVAPTCEKTGKSVWMCKSCGVNNFVKEDKALGHLYTTSNTSIGDGSRSVNWEITIPSTCSIKGGVYVRCLRECCEATWAEGNAVYDYLNNFVATDKVDTWGKKTVGDNSYYPAGRHWVLKKGTEQELDPEAHSTVKRTEVEVYDKTETCESWAVVLYRCDMCSEKYTEQIAKTEEEQENSHEWVWYVEEPKEATCTEAGIAEWKVCTKCAKEVKEKTKEALGHDTVDKAEVPATCEKPKKVACKYCKRCEKYITQDEEGKDVLTNDWPTEGEPLGHDLAPEFVYPTTLPGNGQVAMVCQRTGCDHKEGAVDTCTFTKVLTVAPNCEKVGYELWKCTGCDELGEGKDHAANEHWLVTKFIQLTNTQHKWCTAENNNEGFTQCYKAPTCVSGFACCYICGATKTLDPVGNHYNEYVINAGEENETVEHYVLIKDNCATNFKATLDDKGNLVFVYDEDGELVKNTSFYCYICEQTITVAAHDSVTGTWPANCISYGYTGKFCQNCKKIYDKEPIDGDVQLEANMKNCIGAAYNKETLTVAEVEALVAAGFETVDYVEPTAVKDGSVKVVCKLCEKHVYTYEVSKLDQELNVRVEYVPYIEVLDEEGNIDTVKSKLGFDSGATFVNGGKAILNIYVEGSYKLVSGNVEIALPYVIDDDNVKNFFYNVSVDAAGNFRYEDGDGFTIKLAQNADGMIGIVINTFDMETFTFNPVDATEEKLLVSVVLDINPGMYSEKGAVKSAYSGHAIQGGKVQPEFVSASYQYIGLDDDGEEVTCTSKKINILDPDEDNQWNNRIGAEKLGDFYYDDDHSGKIDMMDWNAIVSAILADKDETFYSALADVNLDGIVDFADLDLLVEAMAQIDYAGVIAGAESMIEVYN